MTGEGSPAAEDAPEGVDPGVAHPSRVYDYWLGGTVNFAADRAAAEQVIAARPSVVRDIRLNRAFLLRSSARLSPRAGGSGPASG